MKVKKLIKLLKQFDPNQDVQIEIAVYDATLHCNKIEAVCEAKMRDPYAIPCVIVAGYASEDLRKL